MDVFIVISFIVAFQVLGYYERLENREYNEQHLLTEDFAVTVKNLPKFKDYQSLLELKARLWDHIETKVLEEPNQIVNIHFARADVKKLKILINIKTMKTKIKRERATLKLADSKNEPIEYQRNKKRVETLKKKI